MRAIFISFLFSLCTLLAPSQLLANDFRDGVRAYNKKDFSRALALWLPLAEQEHVLAQTLVGSMYAYGEGTERDDTQAVNWFTRAAKNGSAQAQYNLGIMYEQGFGVDKNKAQARRWFQAAAVQGRKDAASRLILLGGEDSAPATADSVSTPPAAVAEEPLLGPPSISNDASANVTDTSLPVTSPVSEDSPATLAVEPPPTPSLVPVDMPATVTQEALLGPPLPEEEERRGQTWLNSQPAQHYTIQLAASLKPKLIEDHIKQFALTGDFAHIVSLRDGQEWHGIVYGSYASMSEARDALEALPGHWQSWQPWVRAFGTIKSHPRAQAFHIQ
jgi:hypothetical protein